LLLLLVAVPARAADPDALWKIIRDRCVPDQAQHDNPAPCALVSPQGWVVMKDRNGVGQYLLMPTARVTGIEDPAVLAPDAPNYWQAAWDARRFLLGRIEKELPRDAISLAINSPFGRTQDQLHIHVDCVGMTVRDTLQARLATIGTDWTPLGVPLEGHPYIARRLDGADLSAADPFRLLAAAPQVGAAGIGDWTLVVVGARFPDGRDGFVLLADRANLAAGDHGSGEELQDHACALARTPD
jgi:CDP-diacylglycerol pyrophosphatase